MQSVIRIGSRESALAVRQTEIIRDLIRAERPDIRVEIITIKTTGDRIPDQSPYRIGGKGLFVKELDQALASVRFDNAVHSLKDMPVEDNEALPILAFGRREDPRDVLLYRAGSKEGEGFRPGESFVIGTSSRRRALQLERIFPGCVCRGIRGNVQTRIRKLETEGYDATVLAAAGLKRLGMESLIGRYLSLDEMLPAAGQGILAVQGRREDKALRALLGRLDDPDSHTAAAAERQFIRTLGGGCTSPNAAYAVVKGAEVMLTGMYCEEGEKELRMGTVHAAAEQAAQAGESLALSLLKGEGERKPV